MNKRLLIILIVSLSLPIVLATWLGLSALAEDKERSRLRAADSLAAVLADIDQQLTSLVNHYTDQFRDLARSLGPDPNLLRPLSDSHPLIRQAFWLKPDGTLGYPAAQPGLVLDSVEKAFLERTASLLGDHWIPRGLPDATDRGSSNPNEGWARWQWADGTQWAYWVKIDAGYLGLEINRSALLARFITELTDPTIPDGQRNLHRLRLIDQSGTAIYQWGGWNPEGTPNPIARRPLMGLLSGWALTYELDPSLWDQAGSSATLAIAFAIAAVVLAALAVGFVGLRQLRRALIEAGQRVSFVNQVSHELKTPLTNIRLYAELLETRLGADSPTTDPETTEFLTIIRRETQRLSRLIHNVLSFSRHDKPGRLHLRRGNPMDQVRQTHRMFEPAVAEHGLVLSLAVDTGAIGAQADNRSFDPDVIDQILANLIANAEKYAASGQKIEIQAWFEADNLLVRVRDYGPGIPPAFRPKLFQPFERLHTSVTDAVGGTGLGLCISRNLARQHGGDLVLEDLAESGASFLVRLHTPIKEQP